jgi:hypothetical protein
MRETSVIEQMVHSACLATALRNRAAEVPERAEGFLTVAAAMSERVRILAAHIEPGEPA